jgi:hypothetical protein
VQLLLATREKLRDEAAAFVLHALPAALCAEEPGLSDEVVRRLLADLSAACQQIRGLNDALLQRLLRAIAPIFGVEAHSEGAGELLSKLRVWRQSYVLLGDADISDDASIVSELLAAPNDDPLKLLLTTLPSKLREVRAPYGSWRSWGQHTTYVQSLKDAADEIAKVGEVKDATPEARQMWDELKYKIAGLSRDEQRWVIKAFSEEFRV